MHRGRFRSQKSVSRLTKLIASSLSQDLAGASADQSWGFTYNPASQIRTRTSSNDAYASTSAYAVNRPYSVNGLNQYTAAGPATFRYDANGNLDHDGSTEFGYDAENRLTGSSGARSSRLVYDPLGRLFQTSDFAGQGVTQFLWDGDELVAEYDASGAMQVRYVHGLGSDDPIGSYAGAGMGDRRQYFMDRQGSMVAVTNGTGWPLLINAFDAWGIPNASNQGRFGYTGQIWIPELGMWHYKARVYSPTLGRFMQTDPVGYEDQINLYAYVGNDPVNAVDPSGRCVERRDSGGRVSHVGICGTSPEAAAIVAERLADPHSRIAEVEALAVEQNPLVPLVLGSRLPNGDPVDSAATATLVGRDGRRVPGVILDRTDTGIVSGRDSASGRRVERHEMSDAETLEHEIVGHIRDRLLGRRPGNEENAIAQENAYRERRGDSFRRDRHRGSVVPRCQQGICPW